MALTRRVYFRPASEGPAEAIAPVAPAGAYFAVLLDSTPIGLASVTIDTLSDAVRVRSVFDILVPSDGVRERLVRRQDATFSRGLRFRSATLLRVTGTSRDSVTFTASGDSVLVRRRAPAPRGLSVDTLAPLAGRPMAPVPAIGLPVVFLRPPRVGGARQLVLIDLIGGDAEPLLLRIVAESTIVVRDSVAFDALAGALRPVTTDTMSAWRVAADGGSGPDLWVGEDGLPLGGELRPGLQLVRQPFEIVSAQHRATLAAEAEAGPPSGQVSGHTPPRWRRARVLLAAGTELSSLVDSAGPQGRTGDTLVVQVPAEGGDNADLRRALDLAQRARQVGGTTEVAARTARLVRAVHIQSRLASGLVADGRGNWQPHTWLEVLVDGRWVGIDPARVSPASAAYLRLVSGRAAPSLELLALKARLEPRVLIGQ